MWHCRNKMVWRSYKTLSFKGIVISCGVFMWSLWTLPDKLHFPVCQFCLPHSFMFPPSKALTDMILCAERESVTGQRNLSTRRHANHRRVLNSWSLKEITEHSASPISLHFSPNLHQSALCLTSNKFYGLYNGNTLSAYLQLGFAIVS